MLLDVNNLNVQIKTEDTVICPVDDASFNLDSHQALGIVGESGCGKTMLALSLMRLLPRPGGKIGDGSISWNGSELTSLPEGEMRKLRGKDMAMVFQEPMTSLNPVMKVGNQIGEAISIHNNISRSEVTKRTLELLKLVGIPDPEQRIKNYPHELSGGMRQRAMIAMSLSCNPKLLIADEPTTALDVTIQTQILDLIKGLRNDLGMSLLLVTHDFGVVAEVTERVIVMYAGQFVEEGPTETVFSSPLHPYTEALLGSLPGKKGKRLNAIPGRVPELNDLPTGCRFAPRCSRAKEECRQAKINYDDKGSGRKVRCLFPVEN